MRSNRNFDPITKFLVVIYLTQYCFLFNYS